MHIRELELEGAYAIELERKSDDRGYFARTFCAEEFGAIGLPTQFVQCNISYNNRRGTLRGMHFQREPMEEGKLVTCIRGSIYDVVLDLRPSSQTFCQWMGIELDGRTKKMIYIPPGFAHGFQTLEDESEVFYQMTNYYDSNLADGVRWDDPAFEIKWPISEIIISEKDKAYGDFHP